MGKNPLEEMNSLHNQQSPKVQNAVFGYNLKNDRMILVHF